MRTEVTNVPLQFLDRRRVYVCDADGKHAAKRIKVKFECVGFSQPDEIVGLARRLNATKRKRGRPRKYVALELSAHPSDEIKSKDSFRSKAEMKRVADEILKEFHGVYALVGYHGLRDIHVLILNWGRTGLGLKAYLPNRSRPKRVLVAIVDRVEREINEERKAKGEVLLRPMEEVRAKNRKSRRRHPMHEQIAEHLPLDNESTVADILRAIQECGWQGVVRGRKISVAFSPSRPPKRFELDLFLRGALRAWQNLQKKRRQEKEKLLPPFEKLTAQVHIFVQTGNMAEWAWQWLEARDDAIRPSEQLEPFLACASIPEANELKETMGHANEILADRKLDREGPARRDEW